MPDEKYRLVVEHRDGNVLLAIRPTLPETPAVGYSPEAAEKLARGILEAAEIARKARSRSTGKTD